MSHSHRWKQATFFIPSYRIGSLIAIQHRISISTLEDLTVWTSDRNPWNEEISAFIEAPRLRRVDLNDWLGEHPRFELPWSQLTHLLLPDATFFSLVEVRHVFARCPNIKECHIRLSEPSVIRQDVTIITHQQLRSLGTNAGGLNGSQIIWYLTLPALVDLRLRVSAETTTDFA